MNTSAGFGETIKRGYYAHIDETCFCVRKFIGVLAMLISFSFKFFSPQATSTPIFLNELHALIL